VVVRLGAPTDFSPNDARTLNDLGAKVTPSASVTDDWASERAPVSLGNAPGILANLRVGAPASRTVTLHLVNLGSGPRSGVESNSVTVDVALTYLPKGPLRAHLFGVGLGQKPIPITLGKSTATVTIPYPELWSILSIEGGGS